jgi:CubicO group peptidase (beta-lactamase class C family)
MFFLLSLTIHTSTGSAIGHSNDNYNPSLTRDYWPTDGWLDSTPEEQGMNSTILQEMLDYIEDRNYDIYSVVVIRNGYKVFENYFESFIDENSTHFLYSVTKSFTSALIGICIDKGYIDNTSQTLLSFFPEYTITNIDERRERITIEHLLTMRSGLAWDESSAPFDSPANDVYHINNGDGVQYCLNLDMEAEPGEYWHYNTGASHLLAAIVQKTTGMTTLEFAIENLFDPLGIDPVFWSQDTAGWYKGGFDLQMSTRNMAKFGYLFLNNGSWDGVQIVSEEWVNASTTTITQVNSNNGYSKQWWTHPELNMYFAAGLYGQYIFVVPKHDIIVTFNSGLGRTEFHPHTTLVDRFILDSIIEESDTQNTDTQFPNDVLIITLAIVIALPAVIAGVYWFKYRNR